MEKAWVNTIQAQIHELHPYLPGKPIETVAKEIGVAPSEIVKLASNENPLGCSPKVREAILAELSDINRYPDNDALDFKSKLSAYLGVSESQIILGNGSCEVLDMIGRVFLGPGKAALYSQHAFAVYPILTQTLGAIHQVVPAQSYGHDLSESLKRINDQTAVIFVTNPNNPTGTWITKTELLAFLQQVPAHVIVVLDEAYIEYVNNEDMPNGVELLNEFPNLIVTRTFSKAFGLAGLRVGYGVASPEMVAWLNRVRPPFNVDAIALKSASVALEDAEYLEAVISQNESGKTFFESSFKRLGIHYIPSRGNFITIECRRKGGEIAQSLEKRGVITRPLANYEMPYHLRISIGLDAENEKCVGAIEVLMKEGMWD